MTQKKLKGRSIKEYELNEAYNKMLIWFFSYPSREVSLNDLVENLEISKTTANRVINRLEKEEFLKKEVLGRIWRIKCNQEHIFNFSKKIGFNLSNIYETGIVDRIHEAIPDARAIILFGSYRKGDDTEKSDIDIAVEVLRNQDLSIVNLGMFPELGYRKDVMINLHVFSRNKIDINLFSNIANGIVLSGFLEVRP